MKEERSSLKVAVDLGNGFVKAASENNQFIIPSSIVMSDSISIDKKDLGESYNVYEVEGIEFVCGKAIEDPKFLIESNDLIQTYSKSKNRYTFKPFQNLFLATIAELIKAEIISSDIIVEVDIVTGTPSDNLTDETKNTITNFLKNGTHVVRINRELEVKFIVVGLAIMEQPLATLLNVGINDNGTFNGKVLSENNIVVDFGAGTTIIDTYFKGKRVIDKSKTISRGMKDIYSTVLKKLPHNDLLNINDIETSLKNKRNIDLGRFNINYDLVNGLFNQNAKIFIEYTLITELENISNNNLRLNIYVTGGGSYLLNDLLLKTSLNIVPNSQMSGAHGMIKYNKVFMVEKDNE